MPFNIAKEKREFAVAELLKKCVLNVVEIVCPENKMFTNISLSRRITTRRIEDMEQDFLDQLLHQVWEI